MADSTISKTQGQLGSTIGGAIETKVLRNNSGMIRDFWWEPDKSFPDKTVLVIRQIRFVEGNPAIKVIRLTEEEAIIIFRNLERKDK